MSVTYEAEMVFDDCVRISHDRYVQFKKAEAKLERIRHAMECQPVLGLEIRIRSILKDE